MRRFGWWLRCGDVRPGTARHAARARRARAAIEMRFSLSPPAVSVSRRAGVTGRSWPKRSRRAPSDQITKLRQFLQLFLAGARQDDLSFFVIQFQLIEGGCDQVTAETEESSHLYDGE